MKVLGVDPGLVISGYGVVEHRDRATYLLEAGVLDSGTSKDPLEVRLRRLHEEMVSLVEEHLPDAIALEQLYSHYEHPRTAILMGHARGVICLTAGLFSIPLHHYAATQVKSALTGNGRASKAQMQRMVQHAFNLPEIPDPPDAADAVAIALCHVHHHTATLTNDRLRLLT